MPLDPYTLNVRNLIDKKNNRKLTLVGTLNCSNMHAYRTQALLEKLNPDSILIQTDSSWYENLTKFSTKFNDNREIQRICYKDVLEKIGSPHNFRGYFF